MFGDWKKLEIVNTQQIRIGGASSSIDLQNQPLFIVDGKIINDKKFRQIDPNNIDKITVLKGMSAAALYGARAKNGAIVISTKKK